MNSDNFDGAGSTKQVDVMDDSLDCFERLEMGVNNSKLPAVQKNILKALQKDQIAHLKLEQEYRMEWNQLKLKFLNKFRPLYASRKSVLTEEAPGTAQPTTGTAALPSFWLTALRNHILLAEMIEPHDANILVFLQDVAFEWVDPVEQTSFKLEFYFAPNDFFSNDVLIKTYHLDRTDQYDEESVLTKTEGTTIAWKEGRNITQKSVLRKQRNKRTNQTRTIVQVVEDNSFFNFFQSHEIPTETQLEAMSEREVSELEMIVEAELEVGCIIRDKIIPRALGWFLGVERDEDAESDEELSDEDPNEEDEFDEDDEEDDVDEEDSDIDDEESDGDDIHRGNRADKRRGIKGPGGRGPKGLSK